MLLRSPVKKPIITSPYGERILNGKRQFHDGIDVISEIGDTIVCAITDGVVCHDVDFYQEKKRWKDKRHSAGNYVIVKHIIDDKLYYTRYLHLTVNFCYQGQALEKGEPLGIYADVGRSYGAHLHFDMYNSKWKKIDPSFVLKLMEEFK